MRKRSAINYNKLNDCGRPEIKAQKQISGNPPPLHPPPPPPNATPPNPPAREKQYQLNEEKNLKKKVELCLKDSFIQYENKSDNHIYVFSTGMYELYKTETVKFHGNDGSGALENDTASVEHGTDETGRILVETVIRVHRKTQRGCGRLKSCLNMYHTKNKVMVNGPDIGSFNKYHRLIVADILSCNDIVSLGKKIKNFC